MPTGDPFLGQTLADRYAVRRLIGEGRSGRVYVAMDPREKRRVAIKVLHAHLTSVDEQLARFSREFDAASRITHPNTVRMYEFAQHGGRRFLVMELLEGKRLDEVLQLQKKLPIRRVLRIAAQIARALAAAHEVGVVHRDLNPANVLVCKRPDGEHVKVLDFGLARLLDDQAELTEVGQRLGRDQYMAPEYIQHAQFDARSDVYALGCVIYELLTGRPPFIGKSMKVLDGHANRPPPVPSADVPNLPGWLDELVLQLLAKAPSDRPTAAAAAERLEAGATALEAHPDDHGSFGSTERATLPPTFSSGMAHATVGEPAAVRVARPSPPLGIVAQLLLVAALLVGSTVAAAALTWLALAVF